MKVKDPRKESLMSDMRFDPHDMWAKMKKNSDGLVPAITQDFDNNDVLMMAYMNEEAFCLTCETGYMHYYSRSRDTLWKRVRLRATSRKSSKLISTATGIRSFIRSTRRELPAIQATGHVFIQNLRTGTLP